jgi:glutathione S-transferase
LPVLVDGEVVLNESVAIVLYLAGQIPGARAAPHRRRDSRGARPLAAVHGHGARATALAHRAQHVRLPGGTTACG